MVGLLAPLYFMSLMHLKCMIALSEFWLSFPQGQQFIPDSGFLFLFIHQSHPSLTLSQKHDAMNDKRLKPPPTTHLQEMFKPDQVRFGSSEHSQVWPQRSCCGSDVILGGKPAQTPKCPDT